MIKKELTLTPQCGQPLRERLSNPARLRDALTQILTALAVFTTRLTGFSVTARGMAHLLHAQAGVFLLFLPVVLPLWLRLLAVVWVVWAVRQVVVGRK